MCNERSGMQGLTHDFLHSLYALHCVSLNADEKGVARLVLKVLLAHRPIAAVPPQALETLVCYLLARIEIFAIGLA